MLQAILEEITLQQNFFEEDIIETIYFGGGTPSLLTADDIKRITQKIEETFPIQNIKEFTLEANPDDLTHQYLKSIRTTNINRFSIGVQSFFDRDLKFMNRAHNAQEADYCIKLAQDSGFENLTIDLIYGTPGLSNKDWLYNLQQVAGLRIPHFSAYALTVEEGTKLYHDVKKGLTAPTDNESAAHHFELLTEQAQAMGYEHYEISNLAANGMYAIHNTNYWRGKKYLGIGPSAHSFDGKNRRWNIANNALYMKSILTERKLNYEEERLTPIQQVNEYIMTSLRTMWGLDLNKVYTQWGNDVKEELLNASLPFQAQGKITLENDHLILSPSGKLFADGIAGELFLTE